MMEVALISRTKLNGLGRHYGVVFGGLPGLPVTVYELQPEGVRALSVEQFAQGRRTRQDGPIRDGAAAIQAYQRLSEARASAKSYDLFEHNCEHFARCVMYGTRRSDQVVGMAVGTVAAAVIFVALRKAG